MAKQRWRLFFKASQNRKGHTQKCLHCKAGPHRMEYITPARDEYYSYKHEDQNRTHLHRKNEVTNSVLEICICVLLFICLWAIYIFPRSVSLYILLQEHMWTDSGSARVNRSQTHECGNWEWGRAIPFLVIHKWDFHCSVEKQPTETWRGWKEPQKNERNLQSLHGAEETKHSLTTQVVQGL